MAKQSKAKCRANARAMRFYKRRGGIAKLWVDVNVIRPLVKRLCEIEEDIILNGRKELL